MANKISANVRFGDAKDELVKILEISKDFEPFKVPIGIKEQILRASELVGRGREQDAVIALGGAVHGIKLVLSAFFKNSPRYFERLLNSFSGFDLDLVERASKHFSQLRDLAGSQTEIDLEQAAAVYKNCRQAFTVAQEEMDQRTANRQLQHQTQLREKQEKRRQLQKQQQVKALKRQRELEQAQAQQNAEQIREIAMAI